MSQEQWTAVDRYITELFAPPDAALDAALQSSFEAGLPPINVTPNQGKLLHILALACQARSILEIGTLGGYSTIWLGRALPAEGKLVTLEYNPKHAAVARANIARANLSERVEVRVGNALETLPQIASEGYAPFDFVFIDADKQNTPTYFEWALKLTRRGGLILTDNVIRSGAVIDDKTSDQSVQGMRRFNKILASERRVTATVIQTVGSKGYDGFAVAVVNRHE